MLNGNVGIMLYVEDVPREKDFWKKIGFEISNEKEMMGYEMFDMKSAPTSSCTISTKPSP